MKIVRLRNGCIARSFARRNHVDDVALARGVGEIGMTGVAAAIANAVYHATGVRVRDLPIVPEKLLLAPAGAA